MSSGFVVKQSTGSGAPTLNGTAGALIAVLDWALETGDATNGWEKVYTGTNKAVYRSRYGNRHYLRVDDTSTTAATVRGYESMTDVDTGVDPFPTATQHANSRWVKSASADTTARAYFVVKTARYFMIWTRADGTNYWPYFFGEVKSEFANDPWNTLIGVQSETHLTSYEYTSLGTSSPGNITPLYAAAASAQANDACNYFVRNPSGTLKSVASRLSLAYRSASSGYPYANEQSGKLTSYRIPVSGWVGTSSHAPPRAYLPYLVWLPYASGITVGDTYSEGGVTYQIVRNCPSSGGPFYALRTSDDPEQP